MKILIGRISSGSDVLHVLHRADDPDARQEITNRLERFGLPVQFSTAHDKSGDETGYDLTTGVLAVSGSGTCRFMA